ncbi:unnamed protein product [Symbiodinium natans]|uniref:Right handed beta helix domain-containing protein n=1 Tax=Symbiodinium natans TaxID=878477 RepID=A0A812QIR4_9DINO|nr:unnamed protein product [Symbiodinium natans]
MARMACLLLAWALPVALAERIWDEFREDVSTARQSFLLQQRGGQARDSFGNLQRSGLAKESKGSGRQLPACVGGVLNLSGTYEIWNETVLPGCDVVAHSAVVHIRSQAHQLYFLGSVAFRGQLEVRGRKGELSTACVSVGGNLTVRGDLSFHSCHNGKTLNPLGGGLTVDGDLHLEEGALRFENCSGANRAWKYPGGEGGAFYVQGAYRQRAGTLEAVGCYTQGRGGTFKVKENFEVYGGNVSIRNSSALQGGSIVAHHFKVFGGDVSIRDSWADEDGGAIKAAVLVAGGGVSIRNARAKNGGAIHSWKPSEVSGGVLRIFNASAREDGGAMKADKGLRQTGGVILLERATAGNSGGQPKSVCGAYPLALQRRRVREDLGSFTSEEFSCVGELALHVASMLGAPCCSFVAAGNATKLYPALDLKEVGEEVVAVAETLDPLLVMLQMQGCDGSLLWPNLEELQMAAVTLEEQLVRCACGVAYEGHTGTPRVPWTDAAVPAPPMFRRGPVENVCPLIDDTPVIHPGSRVVIFSEKLHGEQREPAVYMKEEPITVKELKAICRTRPDLDRLRSELGHGWTVLATMSVASYSRHEVQLKLGHIQYNPHVEED